MSYSRIESNTTLIFACIKNFLQNKKTLKKCPFLCKKTKFHSKTDSYTKNQQTQKPQNSHTSMMSLLRADSEMIQRRFAGCSPYAFTNLLALSPSCMCPKGKRSPQKFHGGIKNSAKICAPPERRMFQMSAGNIEFPGSFISAGACANSEGLHCNEDLITWSLKM